MIPGTKVRLINGLTDPWGEVGTVGTVVDNPPLAALAQYATVTFVEDLTDDSQWNLYAVTDLEAVSESDPVAAAESA